MSNVILANDGKPFATETAAKSAATRNGIKPEAYIIVEQDGGFAVMLKMSEGSDIPAISVNPAEKYYKVRFHERADANQPRDVILACQGESLQIQRNKEVVLPERFLEVARNAVWDNYEQSPDKPRQVVGRIMAFPFDVLGESTQTEYLEMKNAGTEMTRKGYAESR